MSSVTDQKVSSALSKAYDELQKFYDRVFPQGNTDQVMWKELLHIEDMLTEALKERPLGSMQIRGLVAGHVKSFKASCLRRVDEKPGTNASGGGATAS